MQKLIEFIKLKSRSDPSMVNALDLLEKHPDNQEEVMCMIFSAIYESNKKLATYVVEAKNKETAQETGIVGVNGKPLSRSPVSRK